MRKHLAEFFADQGHGTGRQGEGKEKEDLCFRGQHEPGFSFFI